jgi:hypothetical protein
MAISRSMIVSSMDAPLAWASDSIRMDRRRVTSTWRRCEETMTLRFF